MAKNNFNAAAAANDNAPDPDAQLIQAVLANDLAGVKDALARNANIDTRADDAYTPLMLAAHHGHKDIVDCLLENDADITLTNRLGRNALGEALREHQDDAIVLPLIEAGAPVDVQDILGNTSAIYAAQDDRAVALTALVAAKADFTIPNKKGVTPLIHATKLQQIDAVRAIMDENVAINHQDEDGMTALMHAVQGGNAMLVGAYIALKADIMRIDGKNRRAIDFAKEGGNAQIISLLRAAEEDFYKPFRQGLGGVKSLKTAKFTATPAT